MKTLSKILTAATVAGVTALGTPAMAEERTAEEQETVNLMMAFSSCLKDRLEDVRANPETYSAEFDKTRQDLIEAAKSELLPTMLSDESARGNKSEEEVRALFDQAITLEMPHFREVAVTVVAGRPCQESLEIADVNELLGRYRVIRRQSSLAPDQPVPN